MTQRHAAVLRAVNVGGSGQLPMSELVAFCGAAGFTDVRTCTSIASGNAVFTRALQVRRGSPRCRVR